MRKIILVICLALAAMPVAAQWRIDAPMEVPVAPGGTAQIEVGVTNNGATEANGAFLLRAFVAVAANVVMQNIVSSDPRIACALQGVIGGNQVYTCYCDPIDIGPQGKVTTKYTLGVPLTATPGARISFGLTYQFGGGGTTGRTVSILVGNFPAPKLDIAIAAHHAYEEVDDLYAMWQFAVTNTGDAPTQGTVDVDVSLKLSPGASMVNIGPDDVPGDPNWPARGSVWRYQIAAPIQPGETVLTFPIQFWADGPMRARYEMTALVTGGGSPPDEVTHVFTPLNLFLRDAAAMAMLPVRIDVSGRPRPAQ